ncbi:alpha/beta hydrolase [Flavobacteriaceae bacterium AU392]|nr:alpha/beta hydrolase [Flavobacteriaceae bacterium]RKM86814.1 alpha/beta hydrolase [Flavobacteriaceae bacterium AU392]
MKYYISIITILYSISFYSQEQQTTLYGAVTYDHIIKSDERKEYRVSITLPPGFSPKLSYETLYYLDSWGLKELVCGTYALANLSDYVKSIILVGISTNGDEYDHYVQRALDYTPSPFHTELNNGMIIQLNSRNGQSFSIDSLNTGGAKKFINFLETKVFSLVKEKYPNVSEVKGLIGHSLGGLFGVYVTNKRPDIFKNLIIISPSMWWNNKELFNDEFDKNYKSISTEIKMYTAIGSNEDKRLIKEPFSKLSNILSSIENTNFSYKVKSYEGQNHNSVLLQSIFDGLIYLYGFNNN